MADPFTIAVTVASGIFGAGVGWAALSAKVSTITKKVTEHEERFKKNEDQISNIKDDNANRRVEHERMATRVTVLERADDERVIGMEKIENETREQTGMLMDIQRRLGRVATPSSDMRSTLSDAPRPAPLPPMRQRLRSSRGGAE